MAQNPWKKLLQNINLSAKTSGGKSAAGGANNKHYILIKKLPNRTVNLTPEDLERQFIKQDGKCYWLGIKLNPSDIFKPFYPLAMSVDRINNEEGYHPDNIVICCRFANLGRGKADINTTKMIIETIKKEIKDGMD